MYIFTIYFMNRRGLIRSKLTLILKNLIRTNGLKNSLTIDMGKIMRELFKLGYY